MKKIVLLSFIIIQVSYTLHAAENTKTNFVIILADDLGYGDLSCYGAEKINTPQLDQMAKEGLRFTSYYATSPACTPSRAGLFTGRMHVRSGMNNVLFPFSRGGLPAEESTLAELLKGAGYATACIGKWHLGLQEAYLPLQHGFDYYFGIPFSNDMGDEEGKYPPLPLMRNNEVIEAPAVQDTLTKRYTEEAIRFITENKDNPFFLYLPHSMPHVPLHVSDGFRGKSSGGRYGDVIEELDWSAGRILDTLRELNLDTNTLVIFTSDNGPWLIKGEDGGSAGILREGKGTCFEGGQRVPAIAWWPGKIPAGKEESGIVSAFDFLPTFCALAGVAPPDDRALDGKDISACLFGETPSPNTEFHYYLANRHMAVREGKWKLKPAMDRSVYGNQMKHDTLLIDLEADPGETKNLAGEHPEIVKALEEKMKAYEAGLGDLPATVN